MSAVRKEVRVAVADDSSFIRRAIARMFEKQPGVRLVGSAANGEDLLAKLDEWRPDVVILDLSMPGMGGLPTLDQIMARRPLPVIILSTHTRNGAPLTIEALHRGAVDFIDKQRYSLVDFEALRGILLEKIRQVTSRKSARRGAQEAPAPARTQPARNASLAPELVVLGASTGGPPAVEEILRGLGPDLPVPVVVVQHMPVGFTRAFAERLDAFLPLRVREPKDDEELRPGTVYIAPAGLQLRVVRSGESLRVSLDGEPGRGPHCPSVDVLFSSARAAVGKRAVAVLLTGMGQDGARGMAELVQHGAHTIAQDEASCVVYGMPRAALAAGGVCETLPLTCIGSRLRCLLLGPADAGREE
ncbi:MAG TPA: chemotaxis-specific protein-glutamate methyltransferase CheB [Thermoanaerobaculia bacterium]|nr:chemotaxis-specific protein-glutamate methyltransferase CheB [Thermoanaerobaculia bacterium]